LAFSDVFPESLREALEKVTKIPTYGERGAGRLVYNLLKLSPSERKEVVSALLRAVEVLKPCSECYLLTDGDLCKVCADPERSRRFICVVEDVERVGRYRAREVIVATNPNAEGEATANYLIKLLKERFPRLRVSRISYGLQFGSVLEFVDEVSLEKSFENRK